MEDHKENTSSNWAFKKIVELIGKAFILRALGAGLAFLFSVSIGRMLGPDGAGMYFLSLSIVSICAVFAKLGLDNALLRLIAFEVAHKNWGEVRGVFRTGMSTAGATSVVISIGIAALAPIIAAKIFHNPDMALTLQIMSFGVFSFSMMTLLSECLKGLQCILFSMLVSGVFFPMIALSIIWPFAAWFGPAGAALAYVVGTSLSAFIGWIMWRRSFGPDVEIESIERKSLVRQARPLWLMAVINRAILPWLPLFLLGLWSDAADAGIFGAATRLALIVTLFLTSANAVIAPKIAELHARGQIQEIRNLAIRSAIFISLLSSPVLFTLIFASDWVMGLYGVEFERGGGALTILAVGQAVVAATGVGGQVLMMTNNFHDTRNSSILGVIAMSIAAAIAIPTLGPEGAALSNAVGISAMNVFSALMAFKRLRLPE